MWPCSKSILNSPVNRKHASILRGLASWVDQLTVFVTGLLLLPLYFKYLGVEGYGLWVGTGGLVAWLSMMNISGVVGQRIAYFYGRNDCVLAASYFWSSCIVSIITSIVVCLLGCCLMVLLPKVLAIPIELLSDLQGALAVAVLAMAIQIATGTASPFLNALQRPVWILAQRPFVAVAQVFVTYYCLINGAGLYAIPLGLLVRNGLIGLWGMYVSVAYALQLSSRVEPTRVICFELFRYMPSFMFGLVGQGMCAKTQFTLIASLISPQAAAAYDVTTKSLQFVQMFLNRISLALSPSFTHLFGEGKQARALAIMGKFSFMTIVLLGLSGGGYLLFNKPFVRFWVGSELNLGLYVMTAALVASVNLVVFEGLRSFVFSVGKIHISSLCAGVAAITQLLVLSFGMSFFGLVVGVTLMGLSLLPFIIFLLIRLRMELAGAFMGKAHLLIAGCSICILCLSFYGSGLLEIVTLTQLIFSVLVYGFLTMLVFIILPFMLNKFKKIQL